MNARKEPQPQRKPEQRQRTGRTGSKKARINYAADFETITDPNDCRVWAWGIADFENPDESFEHGLTIETFIDRISETNCNVYFHNLKFDGNFIIYWLLTNGFKHSADKSGHLPLTFKTLISDSNAFYSITVKWANGHTTEFRDSAKKIPNQTVARVAETFKLPITKGDIDYKKYRAVNQPLTAEELDYLKRDVVIIASAMKIIHENGMKKLTIASDTLSEYKSIMGPKVFERLFPVLSEAMDAEIRRAYRGGFTYAAPRFKGKLQGSGLVLDVNSLYPSVMRHSVLPFGEPEFVRGRVEPTISRPLTIFSVTFTAKLKKDHIPCIQIKGSFIFSATEYLTEIKEPTDLMVTNVDWELYNKHYDIKVLAYGGGWRFKGTRGLFDTYIDKWSKVKENSEGGQREIAKLHLNSLYGKFASNPSVTGKIPVIGPDGAVKYKRGPDETVDPVYTAMGVFITAYAREITISAAQVNYDTFAYADTDSLHLLRDTIPEGIEVHKTKMGAWKLEYHFEKAFYVRSKVYLEKLAGVENEHKDYCSDDCAVRHDYKNAFAGLPDRVSSTLTFDDLVEGRVFEGKLSPKSVPGGVVLVDVPFKLTL